MVLVHKFLLFSLPYIFFALLYDYYYTPALHICGWIKMRQKKTEETRLKYILCMCMCGIWIFWMLSENYIFWLALNHTYRTHARHRHLTLWLFRTFMPFFRLSLYYFFSVCISKGICQIDCGLALITHRIFSKVCYHHPFLCNPFCFWYGSGIGWKIFFFGSANLTIFSSSFLCENINVGQNNRVSVTTVKFDVTGTRSRHHYHVISKNFNIRRTL